MRGRIETSSSEKPISNGSGRLFWLIFAFSTLAGLTIQLILLPHVFPQLHAGNGLLLSFPDSVGFHDEAVKLARAISDTGWFALSLRPQNNAPVAIAAVVYTITHIYMPWILVPLHGAVFALGAVGLYNIYRRIAAAKPALLGTAPFVLLPSSTLLYSQIHKDVWTAAGFVWLAYAAVISCDFRLPVPRRIWAATFAATVASLAIWVMRPYLVQIVATAFLVAVGIGLVWALVSAGGRSLRDAAGSLAAAAICLTVMAFFIGDGPIKLAKYAGASPADASTTLLEARDLAAHPERPDCKKTSTDLASRLLPSAVTRRLEALINAREIFISAALGAGSNIDQDVCFRNAGDVLGYLPRAIQIGLFAPFPDTLLNEEPGSKPTAIRRLAIWETVVTSILLAGFIPLLLTSGAPTLGRVAIITTFAIAVLTITSIGIPNIGTLFRVRYGYLNVLTGLGSIGWTSLACAVMTKRQRPLASEIRLH